MPKCLYCNKHVNEGVRGTKKLHGDRMEKGSCNYKYMLKQCSIKSSNRKRGTELKYKRDRALVARAYIKRDDFNDSFGV